MVLESYGITISFFLQFLICSEAQKLAFKNIIASAQNLAYHSGFQTFQSCDLLFASTAYGNPIGLVAATLMEKTNLFFLIQFSVRLVRRMSLFLATFGTEHSLLSCQLVHTNSIFSKKKLILYSEQQVVTKGPSGLSVK